MKDCCKETLARYVQRSGTDKQKKVFWLGVSWFNKKCKEVGLNLNGLLKTSKEDLENEKEDRARVLPKCTMSKC